MLFRNCRNTGGEMVRGGTEAHRGSAPTAEGPGNFSGAIGGAMKRSVLRDDEARAESVAAVYNNCL